MSELPTFSPSEFVSLVNQTFEYAFQNVTIVGELSSFTISKNRWVYADLKDDSAKLRLFGTIYQLPGPLEDGMMIEVIGEPRLHPQFGFSLQIKSMRAVGEGSIKKAQNLLQAKLEQEGLFAPERKRQIPYAPERIGLVASAQSAAYADFIKILDARWQGVEVIVYDSQVQGDAAVKNLVEGISYFNGLSHPVEAVVMIRGGGSIDDLGAFSTEQVTRAVASSRAPTVVAIGHEVDTCLAELAADLRASTPSNAAELLFPDRIIKQEQLKTYLQQLSGIVDERLDRKVEALQSQHNMLHEHVLQVIQRKREALSHADALLESIHPKSTLRRGFVLLQSHGKLISSTSQLQPLDKIELTLQDGTADATINKIIKG
jgi:exodeoxyribonuclease VII large subunit